MSERSSVSQEQAVRLRRHLSPLAVWALSFGCSVGWGAFVMPGTTFLPIAGPVGTAIGMVIGALVMLIIGCNYHALMNRYPDAGGTVSFSRQLFGYDHAFLAGWFLVLVYLAIIWANATAIPLIFRGLFGDVLQFGFHYTVAGYDVYLGEILISLSSLAASALLCIRGGRVTSAVQVIMALLLIAGVLFGFFAAFARPEGAAVPNLTPFFAPGHAPGVGILFIVFLAPWAFAGFESVSHSTEEFRFSPKKSLRIMTVALVTAAAAYALLALVAVAALPQGYSGWVDYIRDIGNLRGLSGIPVFFSIYASAGTPGLVALCVATGAAIITGLVGNMVAASRMLFSVARQDLIPASVGKLNDHGAPRNAILLLLLVSLPIPFLGRSAIGWIIDVNTIGVTIAYAYTSAAAWKCARLDRRPCLQVTGFLGMAVSVFFLLYFLVPNLWSVSALSSESYFIFLTWSALGFVAYYLIFRRDPQHRLGKSTMVWAALLALIFLTSLLWIIGVRQNITAQAVNELGQAYATRGSEGFAAALTLALDRVTRVIFSSTIIQLLIILASLFIIFKIYSTVQKQHQTAVEDKTIAEQSSQAKTTFLSNMSHDIRTPMNAIVGYAALAKREKDLPPRTADYLSKIEASSAHLLSLINDVLEMSRIESGKMELAPVPTDVRRMMDSVRDLFATQMAEKGLDYQVVCQDIRDPGVLCDQTRFDRVLLNLVSNAYKFTPKGGSVTVTMRQTGREADRASFVLSVKDTGIGMSPEFAAKVFEAYERERTATVESIQGTGLGTAITKSIVDLMGGTIEVVSEQGKGSEFVIHVSFPVDPEASGHDVSAQSDHAAHSAFAGMRLLLVEDDPANREVAKTLLEEVGFLVDTVVNGEDAVEAIAAAAPDKYAAVLMDIEMPVKNGYDAARLIRSLKNESLARIPIVALTAKAFSEDIAEARRAGMDAHIAKPISMESLTETMSKILLKRE